MKGAHTDWLVPELTPLEAMRIIEGVVPAPSARVLAAWQTLVDRRLIWSLPSRYLRVARELSTHGYLLAPDHDFVTPEVTPEPTPEV